MKILRDSIVDLPKGEGVFHDDYADNVKYQNTGRLWLSLTDKPLVVPLPIGAKLSDISEDELAEAFTDSKCMYILLVDSIEYEYSFPYKVVYSEEDCEYMFPLAYVVKNVLIVDALPRVAKALTNIEHTVTPEVIKEAKRAAMAKKIHEFIVAGNEREIVSKADELHTLEDTISRARYDLMRALKHKENAERELILLKDAKDNIEIKCKRMEADIEEMLCSPVLKTIEFPDYNTVRFVTNEISITDINGEEHPIGGSMEATVDLSTASLTIYNMDNYLSDEGRRAEGDIQHPHVDSNGHPCLGNIGSVLPDLCFERNIEGIWQIVLSYLTSYNEDDVWGRRLRYWATKEGEFVSVCDTEIYTCESCGCQIEADYDDAYTCTACGALICSDCAYYTEDGDYICPGCATDRYCEVCDCYFNDETYTCDSCGRRVCADCLVEGEYGVYCCDDCLCEAEPAPEEEDEEDDSLEEEE